MNHQNLLFIHDSKIDAQCKLNKHMKRCSSSYSISKVKIKRAIRYDYMPIKITQTHWQHQMLVGMWNNISYLLGRVQNGKPTLEDSLVLSYKTKHTPIIWSHNCVHWYLELASTQNSTHIKINSGFIHDRQNFYSW